MYLTCKHYLERVLGGERSKLGFLEKKGLKLEVFFSGLMSVRLSEPSASSKRACPVDSGHSSLEQAVSETLSERD